MQSEANKAHLNQIKALLRQREPKLEELLAEAMKHERANQAQKDQKVLDILQFKDKSIEKLQIETQACQKEASEGRAVIDRL